MFPRQITLIIGTLSLVTAASVPLVDAQGDMYDRVCPRLVKDFLANPTMWQRVNQRIEKRFGFVCSTQAGSSMAPSVRSSSSSSAHPDPQTFTNCTPAAWSCVAIPICHPDGTYDNICSRTDRSCLHPEAVQPPAKVPCSTSSSSTSSSVSLRDHMKANMDAWTEARKELTTKMENMSHQQNGGGCFTTLAQIDADWVMNYNNYVSLYNNIDNGGDTAYAMQTPERQMKDVIQRIHDAPTYCYY